MSAKSFFGGRGALLATLLGSLGTGCGSGNLSVPEKTQKASEERYGEQQMSMQGLNETSSEQAAARHENSTLPVERPGSERKPASR